MKKPVAIISSDWHLKDDNAEQIIDLAKQKAELADKLDVKNLIILGDVFHSRKAQSQYVLNTFRTILKNILLYHGRTVYAIRGNHDSIEHEGEMSFLTPFSDIENFKLIEVPETIWINGIDFSFIPYFKEDILARYIKETLDFEKRISCAPKVLLTHTAFKGSRNNDGTEMDSKINYDLVKDFDLVISGHYHNMQQVYKNCWHLPSIQQNNHGEDYNKGFCVLFDDLSFEIERSKFKMYHTQILSANDTELHKKMQYAIKQKEETGDYYRTRIEGSKAQLESIDTSELKNAGIKVEKIANDEAYEAPGQITTIDHKSMVQMFKDFCEKEGISYEEGIEYFKCIEQ